MAANAVQSRQMLDVGGPLPDRTFVPRLLCSVSLCNIATDMYVHLYRQLLLRAMAVRYALSNIGGSELPVAVVRTVGQAIKKILY